MLKRMTDAFFWVTGVEQYRRGNFDQARTKLDKVRGKRREASEYHALRATLALINADYSDAELLFRKALHHSTPTRPDYQSYVDHYCGYYLSSLDGDDNTKVKHLEAALRLRAPLLIKQWLPLS